MFNSISTMSSTMNVENIDRIIDINTTTIETNMQIGENGCLEYSSDAISDKLLVAFNRMNRDNQHVDLLVQDILQSIKSCELNDATSKITNTFVLCFLTRYCRGGKGEKSLFYTFFTELAKSFPNSTNLLCGEIANYGYWKDCFVLISLGQLSKSTIIRLLDVVANQISVDLQKIDTVDTGVHISLLAKWLPRENKSLMLSINKVLHLHGLKSLQVELLNRVKLNSSYKGTTFRKYRKIITNLTKHIPIVEQQMCDHHFGDIEFKSVPSLAMNKYKSAFAMESVSAFPKIQRNGKYMVDKFASLTESDKADRELCKKHYSNHMINGKVNGSQMGIDKLVAGIFAQQVLHDTIEEFIEHELLKLALTHRQFESYVDSIQQQLAKAELESKEKLGDNKFTFDITNIKCMTDVSGSMCGTPMYVAIGLTLVLLRLQKIAKSDAFQTFITFDTNPAIVNIGNIKTFPMMVEQIKKAPWGASTDFVKAFDEIMQECGRNIANAPKQLLVLSDMQFNISLGHTYTSYGYGVSIRQTVDTWETMYDTICRKWSAWFGLTEEQTQTMLPTIIFWNLRGEPSGSPVDCTTKGVNQVSGYSASLLKMLLFGEELMLANPTENPNPSQVLARTLQSREYDPIRNALGWVNGNITDDSVFVSEIKAFLDTHEFINVNTRIVDFENEFENEV